MSNPPNQSADLVEQLYESDAASALTNRAAREIERLRAALREISMMNIDSRERTAGQMRAPERYHSEMDPNHPERWLVIGPDGKNDGWSYPSEGTALHACYVSDAAYAEGVKHG